MARSADLHAIPPGADNAFEVDQDSENTAENVKKSSSNKLTCTGAFQVPFHCLNNRGLHYKLLVVPVRSGTYMDICNGPEQLLLRDPLEHPTVMESASMEDVCDEAAVDAIQRQLSGA